MSSWLPTTITRTVDSDWRLVVPRTPEDAFGGVKWLQKLEKETKLNKEGQDEKVRDNVIRCLVNPVGQRHRRLHLLPPISCPENPWHGRVIERVAEITGCDPDDLRWDDVAVQLEQVSRSVNDADNPAYEVLQWLGGLEPFQIRVTRSRYYLRIPLSARIDGILPGRGGNVIILVAGQNVELWDSETWLEYREFIGLKWTQFDACPSRAAT